MTINITTPTGDIHLEASDNSYRINVEAYGVCHDIVDGYTLMDIKPELTLTANED